MGVPHRIADRVHSAARWREEALLVLASIAILLGGELYAVLRARRDG